MLRPGRSAAWLAGLAAAGPNRLWRTDVTGHPTGTGKV